MNTPGTSVSGYILLFTIQFVFIAIFGVYTDYDDDLLPKNGTQAEEGFIIPKYARKSDWIYVSRDGAANVSLYQLTLRNEQIFKTSTAWSLSVSRC